MGEVTGISWCHHTLNRWIGCTKVSPACENCYAEGESKRRGWAKWGAGQPRHNISDATWFQYRKWDRKAGEAGETRRVFLGSLMDVFDPEVPPEWREDIWEAIRETDYLTWLLLTKRPENAKDMLPKDWADICHKVGFGVTAENQKYADLRIPIALQIQAGFHFVSCEPMLGPVDFGRWITRGHAMPDYAPLRPTSDALLGQIICGGESGPKARPMHPDWARKVRDDCEGAGVAFFFKQWGEWFPEAARSDWSLKGDRKYIGFDENGGPFDKGPFMHNVGKKAAGRELDGREWSQMPK